MGDFAKGIAIMVFLAFVLGALFAIGGWLIYDWLSAHVAVIWVS